jgi:hypothetical protein
MKQGWRGLCLGMLAAIAALISFPAAAQVGFDRPGGDYTSFPVRSGDPAACAARCERDSRCRAWAFSYPATEAAGAVCWLKSRVPRRVAAPCCFTGVRGAGVIEPKIGPIEFAVDRAGGDYKSMDLPADPTGKSCQRACEAESECRAWTYVRPGYIGPNAVCYLKNRVTPPRHKPCCLSGVVR